MIGGEAAGGAGPRQATLLTEPRGVAARRRGRGAAGAWRGGQGAPPGGWRLPFVSGAGSGAGAAGLGGRGREPRRTCGPRPQLAAGRGRRRSGGELRGRRWQRGEAEPFPGRDRRPEG